MYATYVRVYLSSHMQTMPHMNSATHAIYTCRHTHTWTWISTTDAWATHRKHWTSRMQQNRVARWIRYSNPSVTAQKRCTKQKYFNIPATATVTQVPTSLLLATWMSVCVHTYYRVGEQNRDLPVIHIYNYKMGSFRIPDTHGLAFSYHWPILTESHSKAIFLWT